MRAEGSPRFAPGALPAKGSLQSNPNIETAGAVGTLARLPRGRRIDGGLTGRSSWPMKLAWSAATRTRCSASTSGSRRSGSWWRRFGGWRPPSPRSDRPRPGRSCLTHWGGSRRARNAQDHDASGTLPDETLGERGGEDADAAHSAAKEQQPLAHGGRRVTAKRRRELDQLPHQLRRLVGLPRCERSVAESGPRGPSTR